jgi:mannose-6-phosphate isomerase-like protein (cupin superfamily)
VSRFVQIASGVETLPLRLELARNEQLWDQDATRRTYPGTPHAAMTDITVRYMAPEDAACIDNRKREHRNVWWPAWHLLPALRPVVFGMMARVQATELGSILITRLPSGGGKILPHSDAGSWAPEYYNCKAHWTVAGKATVDCDDDYCLFEAGTVWTFDNLLTHSVSNEGDEDRICVIVSMRCE